MSKITVPKELEEQIINLYVHKTYTRKQIKTELNLPFGDSVIKRILKENNVPIRTNPGAQKGGRKKQEVDIETQKQIIGLYNKGYGLSKIVQELNLPFSFDKVRTILQDNNIHIRNVKESAQVKEMSDLRKYKVNDDYNFESHNGAWILGFIAADGYLPITRGAKNKVVITLARKDEEILERIAQEIEYTGNIIQFDNNGFPSSSLSFTSKSLRQKIEKYGIGNNKTFRLDKLPNLPEKYMIDFIRGFFDGDGSIFEPQGKKINMNLVCASFNYLKEIAKFLHDKYQLSMPTIHSQTRIHTIYDIRYYVRDSIVLGNLFYDNDYLALARKKNHFLQIKEKYNI